MNCLQHPSAFECVGQIVSSIKFLFCVYDSILLLSAPLSHFSSSLLSFLRFFLLLLLLPLLLRLLLHLLFLLHLLLLPPDSGWRDNSYSQKIERSEYKYLWVLPVSLGDILLLSIFFVDNNSIPVLLLSVVVVVVVVDLSLLQWSSLITKSELHKSVNLHLI